jgi:hypothetical protein
MVYNFITKEPALIVIVTASEEFFTDQLPSVSNTKENLGGHKCKDDYEVITVVTQ